MYKIELRRLAQRSLDKLHPRDFSSVFRVIKALAETPRPKGVEKLKSVGLWRVRQGDYRVVYSIDDNQQLVIIVRVVIEERSTGRSK